MTAKCLSALLLPAALSPRLCPACLLVLDVAAVHQDPPAERGGWHVFLVARGMGSIGKPSYGAGRSVRRLLAGRKTRNGRFQLHPGRGAKNAKKKESESFLKQKVKCLCKKEQQGVGNWA